MITVVEPCLGGEEAEAAVLSGWGARGPEVVVPSPSFVATAVRHCAAGSTYRGVPIGADAGMAAWSSTRAS